MNLSFKKAARPLAVVALALGLSYLQLSASDSETVFALDFGTGTGQSDGSELHISPAEPEVFTLQDNSLKYRPLSGSQLSSSAVYVAEDYLERQDFTLEADMVLTKFEWPEAIRAGLVVLGGPHSESTPFNTTSDQGFYSVSWWPAMNMSESVIMIRRGFNGTILKQAIWGGPHPSQFTAEGGIGETFTLRADGEYDQTGALVLSFTVTGGGHSQTISTDPITQPVHGNLFGIGGRGFDHPDFDHEFDFLDLTMTVHGEPLELVEDPFINKPSTFMFGSLSGRNDGESFRKNLEEDWSLRAAALRLTAGSPDYQNSLATARVLNHTAGEPFYLGLRTTIASLAAGGENRTGLVFLGDTAYANFDEADDSSFYSFQWVASSTGGAGSLVVRQGMNGTVFADLDLDGVADAPVFAQGATVDFEFWGEYNEDGDVEFFAKVSDADREVSFTGLIEDPIEGNRFGFGARHRSGENAAWDFNAFALVNKWVFDYAEFEAPVELDFGNEAEKDGKDGLFFTGRPQEWTLIEDALRFQSTATVGQYTNSGATTILSNYHPAQDFEIETTFTLTASGSAAEPWHRAGVIMLGGPHDTYSPFNTVGSLEFFSAVFLPYQNSMSIRQGATSTLSGASAAWTGPSGTGSGLGTKFTVHTAGTYDEDGNLTIVFTLTHEGGHSQQVTGTVTGPRHGNVFGLIGHSNAGGPAIFDFHDYALSLGDVPEPVTDPSINWPFAYRFGSVSGLDGLADFRGTNSSEWSLGETEVRLSAGSSDYTNALLATRLGNFDKESFGLRTRLTLTSLTSDVHSSGPGLILFGDADPEVFDADDDQTYLSFQWLPNPAEGGRIVLRQGLDGAILAETAFADLDSPPVTQLDTTYTLEFRGFFGDVTGDEVTDLRFVAILSDESGGSARLTGVMEGPLNLGNRVGFGARHSADDDAVWDFHELIMVAGSRANFDPVAAPVAWHLGSGELRNDGASFYSDRPGDWRLQPTAIRQHNTNGSGWVDTANVLQISNYQPGVDFTMEAHVTLDEEGNTGDWERFGMTVLGPEHRPYDGQLFVSTNTSMYNPMIMMGQPGGTRQGHMRIRKGINGSTLVGEAWEGLNHQNGGRGTTYVMRTTGTYNASGHLTISFTVTDANGHSQTISYVDTNPVHGPAFGFGGTGLSWSNRYDYHDLRLWFGEDEPQLPELPSEGVTYADWRGSHFSGDDLTDDSISGPLAAPAGDGIANLLKYAFGFDPMTPVSTKDLVVMEVDEGVLRLVYPERIGAEDIEYLPEATSDLVSWDLEVSEVDRIPDPDDEDFELVTVEAVVGESAARAFIRVRVANN